MAKALTNEEYAEWKSNIEAIDSTHESRDSEITTTIQMQLRLFATIDDLRLRLQEVEGERDEAIKRGVQAWNEALLQAALVEAMRLVSEDYVADYVSAVRERGEAQAEAERLRGLVRRRAAWEEELST